MLEKFLALNIIEVYSEFGFSCHACAYKMLSNKISNFCNIWVILSCTEGWGKDVCLVPGELNEIYG
jgi:hypothetical protein